MRVFCIFRSKAFRILRSIFVVNTDNALIFIVQQSITGAGAGAGAVARVALEMKDYILQIKDKQLQTEILKLNGNYWIV
uniref:Uncharacterized protein n=1 Tax=Syphacia muris TaxID=451379 RepID=A0A0N5AQ77_9BILA